MLENVSLATVGLILPTCGIWPTKINLTTVGLFEDFDQERWDETPKLMGQMSQ